MRTGAIQSDNHLLLDAINFSLFINLAWNVLNLVPVLPLDGGQISREFLAWLLPRNGLAVSIQISIFASGAITVWAIYCIQNHRGLLGLDPTFIAIMFGYLCYQGYQSLQSLRRGYR